MAKRKSISKKTRFEVFKRDSFTCQYCGDSAPSVVLELDHIQPVSKDGDNDILNLLTACAPCNAGKKDRLLSDDSAIAKQKAQLDELNTRREQLEMLIQWRSGLRELSEIEVQAAVDAWAMAVNPYYATDNGIAKIRKLVKQFGLNTVLDAIEKTTTYLETENGQFTEESVNHAFSKIGGICRLSTLPEWKQEIYHVRNIARSRAGGWWHNSTSADVLALLEKAYEAGYRIEDLKVLALDGMSYTRLAATLHRWILEAQNG